MAVEAPPNFEATLLTLSNLMSAFGHPHRLRILASIYFADKPLSPVELAEGLNARLGTMAYHVRTLTAKGLLELDHEERVRGAVQHFYRLSEKGRSIMEWAISLA